MAMKIRIKFDGSCPRHPKYNPAHEDPIRYKGYQCQGCEELHIIWQYSKIVQKHVENTTSLTKNTVGFIIPIKVEGDRLVEQKTVSKDDIDKLLPHQKEAFVQMAGRGTRIAEELFTKDLGKTKLKDDTINKKGKA